MEKTLALPFVFGIGSQRAASTFVSHLLSAIPNAYVHPLKELHYFDTKYGIRNAQVLESFAKYRLTLNTEALTTFEGQSTLESLADQIVSDFKFADDPACANHDYAYHFQAALHRHKEITYLCESTPEYMLLPSEALAEIKAAIPQCKAVLAVRDPIKRFISAFRFLVAHEPFFDEGCEALSQRALEMLARNDGWILQQDQFNQYKLAVSNFEQADIPVFVILTDNLQQRLRETVTALENFLEVKLGGDAVNQLAGKKINEVDFVFNPSTALLETLAERYADDAYVLPPQTVPLSKLSKYSPDSWQPVFP